jgi:hypothetical protein
MTDQPPVIYTPGRAAESIALYDFIGYSAQPVELERDRLNAEIASAERKIAKQKARRKQYKRDLKALNTSTDVTSISECPADMTEAWARLDAQQYEREFDVAARHVNDRCVTANPADDPLVLMTAERDVLAEIVDDALNAIETMRTRSYDAYSALLSYGEHHRRSDLTGGTERVFQTAQQLDQLFADTRARLLASSRPNKNETVSQ